MIVGKKAMGKNGNWLKKFCQAVIQKLAIKAIVAIIVPISLFFVGFIKRTILLSYWTRLLKWLHTEHTIEMPGFGFIYYFSLPLFVPLILGFILWLCFRNSRKLYSGKNVIVHILAQWVIDNEEELSEGKVVSFKEIDKKRNLKKGSTKKYLKLVVDKHENLCVAGVTKETILIQAC